MKSNSLSLSEKSKEFKNIKKHTETYPLLDSFIVFFPVAILKPVFKNQLQYFKTGLIDFQVI